MTKQVIIIIVLALMACSIGQRAIQAQDVPKTWTFGYRYSNVDSSGIHYQGYHRLTKCFPGLSEKAYGAEIKEVKIYTRKGELLFETQRQDENWICADVDTFAWDEGQYFCQMIYVDTVGLDTTGIVIYVYRH